MKILHVVHDFPPYNYGGVEVYTKTLAEELAEKHDVHVLYHISRDSLFNKTKMEFEKFHRIEFVRREKNIFDIFNLENTYKNREFEKTFQAKLEEIRPDIVHFQHILRLSSIFVDICKKYNIPTILTLHDYWFLCHQIKLLTPDFKICNGPSSKKCQKCYLDFLINVISDRFKISKIILNNRIFNRFFKQFLNELDFKERNKILIEFLKNVDIIISPSNFLKSIYVKFGIPKEKIIYSKNGINLNFITGFKKKYSKKIRFGYVGNIHSAKGVHILLDAFNKISCSNAELNIYGRLNHKNEYHKKILINGKYNPKINFNGEFKDINEPYSNIDISIVPSIWYENCPLVIQEAFATKTPVIASNIGALPEFVDNKNGFLFKPNDSDDLANKMSIICNNNDILTKLIKNIPQVKSMKEQSEELIRIYKKLKK